MSRGLLLNMSAVTHSSEDEPCSGTEGFRYLGWLEREQAEGVPWVLIQASPEDVSYVDSIVRGTRVPTVTSTVTAVEQKGSLWPHSSVGEHSAGGVVVSYSFAKDFD